MTQISTMYFLEIQLLTKKNKLGSICDLVAAEIAGMLTTYFNITKVSIGKQST